MLLDYFFTVSEQVVILFILIGIGYLCGKFGFIEDISSKRMTDIVLYIVTPCVMINAYQIDFNPSILANLGITAICAISVHIISIILSGIIFRNGDASKNAVLKFGAIFSNCGFMGIPLAGAVCVIHDLDVRVLLVKVLRDHVHGNFQYSCMELRCCLYERKHQKSFN